MNDPHVRFQAWLADGGGAEPPRDVALHASACAECLRLAAAFDALLVVDPGAVEPPPARPIPTPVARRSLPPPLRAAAGTAAAGLLVVGALIGGSALLERRTSAPVAQGTATPIAEAVLGGQGGAALPVATETPGATPRQASAEPSVASSIPERHAGEDPDPGVGGADTPPPIAAPTFVPATPAPAPAFQPPLGTPRPSAPTLPPTFSPSATPSAVPTTAPTPQPTEVPSEPPTPIPTPAPTPEPSGTPSDSDGDGIPDDVDDCPAEPAGPTPDPFRPGCPLLPP